MFRSLLPVLAVLLCLNCQHFTSRNENERAEAGESLRFWAMARSFPDGQFYTGKYLEAMNQMRVERAMAVQERGSDWEAIGPKNIGGRTLCLAIHPLDTNIIFAGSASGGLWKSTTAGRGVQAWTRIETGFPVLGVSAIAIDPQNPDVMYIGTGEVYNVEFSMPNVAFRTTRGTYGIGILKSTDGGQHWTASLDWTYTDLRGVQDIKINPRRPATVYAATTEGLLRSYDAGASWQTVHNRKMAVDIEINPQDTNVVYVTHGSLDDEAVSGIFRSTNGGNTFQLLKNGISSTYSGKALLGICPGQPQVLYASVGNAFNQEGLYKTVNGGDNWTKVNSQDVCTYQGWYSHDVSVHPSQPDTFVWSGIDMWKSVDGGATATRKTLWYSWFFGQVPVGGPEGPPNYVHADIHRVYWLQNDPNKIYCVSDGGIFVSYTAGETWEGRNGGYQTQQFYANMGNSGTNPALCIGGMQDNSTAIYTGDDAWTRVLGGDGECAAMDPTDDLVMYGSSQYLNLSKSTDGGQSFYSMGSNEMDSESAVFNGPFELAPSDPQILYAGAQSLFRSDDAGLSWTNISNGYLANGDPILALAINPQNPDLVFCSTVPSVTNTARVFRFNASTGVITPVSGLPNRFCMDIIFDPVNPTTLYAVFAGFNSGHVWKSTDAGTSWTSIDNGLPDIPTNTLAVDPQYPMHLYVGNDLGVWLSRNGGNSWELFSSGAPNAMLAMHLGVTPDRKLRVATHGLGVWQAPLAEPVGVKGNDVDLLALQVSPNPAVDALILRFRLNESCKLQYRVVDMQGREMAAGHSRNYTSGEQVEPIACTHWPSGVYGILLEGRTIADGRRLRGSRIFVKK